MTNSFIIQVIILGYLQTGQLFIYDDLALDALLAKTAQVMSVSETPLVHAILQGHKIAIVATVTAHQEVKLIARRDHGITGPSDLRGKKIATLPGTNSDYFMYTLLHQYQIPLAEVYVTNLTPPDMVLALVQGNIDAYFAWEPHIYYAQKQLAQNALVFAPGPLYVGRHCVAMNNDFVQQHPDLVVKLVRGFLRAEQFVHDYPEEAQAIVARKTGIDLPALQALWSEYTVKVQLDAQLPLILEKEARWALAFQKAHTPLPPLLSYIYTAALFKARPAAVAIK